MLDYVGIVLVATAMAVLLAVVICTIPVSLRIRLIVAGAGGAWAGVAIAVATAGKLGGPITLGILAGVPLVAAATLAIAFPGVRSALLAIPLPLVIGANVFRLEGVFFLALASAGRLGGPFPQSAGWGDIIVGALAIPAAFLAMRTSANDARILIWNVLGVLDLVTAVALGITSGNGSPLQLIHAGAGSAAIQALPWSLIPTVLVPLFLIGHGIVFAHARAAASKQRNVSMGARAMRRPA